MKTKILIADDDPDIIEVLTGRLEALSYEVVVAYDGLQAVELVFSENPNLILLDIKMPTTSGVGVFENIRSDERTKDIPVIFITASVDAQIRQKVVDMGAQGVIAKPFTTAELIGNIRRVLENS